LTEPMNRKDQRETASPRQPCLLRKTESMVQSFAARIGSQRRVANP